MAKNTIPSVFITGAAGFIGANLTHALIREEVGEIHILRKKSSNLWRLKDIKEKLIFHQESLSDRNSLKKLLEKIKPKIIYHLATHGAYSYQEEIDEMIRTNILGTLNLLFASKDLSYHCFVNTGTSSEYGMKEKPMREEDVCQPISFYAATKLSATLLCQTFARVYKKPIVTLRPFSVYGPYEEPARFIPTIIHCIIKKEAIRLTPRKIRRDFIYVKDLVNAYLKAPKRVSKISGEILNIGTGKEYTNDEVVKTLFAVVKEKVPIKKGAFLPRVWDTSHWRADTNKAKKLLNWQSQFSLSQGLLKTFKWAKKQYG